MGLAMNGRRLGFYLLTEKGVCSNEVQQRRGEGRGVWVGLIEYNYCVPGRYVQRTEYVGRGPLGR